MNYKFSSHAEKELILRKIPRHLVDSVMQNPQQIIPACRGRKAYQSQLDFGDGRVFLLRAIMDDTFDPAVVVTFYRTKKIRKYWREK